MPSSPESSNNQPPKRKKKACRRCRHRKQKCDFEQPCQNCRSARVVCEPVISEAVEQYPTGYVTALENHAATLERTLNERYPGSAADHLGFLGAEDASLLGASSALRDLQGSPNENMNWQWQNSQQTPLPAFDNLNGPLPGISPVGEMSSSWPRIGILNQNSPHLPNHGPRTNDDVFNEIPTLTAASFFRTYFQFVHPQYPFMDVRACGEWYERWKEEGSGTVALTPSSAYFIKMIFTLGSLLQTKSDTSPQFPHQNLKGQIQSEDTIIHSTSSTPLEKVQSLLLSAVYALHSESTTRIVHLSSTIMKFATLNGYHRLSDDGSEQSRMKIRAWSCAYTLDRGISATLDTPVSLSDIYISSPLFIDTPELSVKMPWLHDLPSQDQHVLPNLSNFAQTCRIRSIQSYIVHNFHSVSLERSLSAEWIESMRLQIDVWAGEIGTHCISDLEGYQSPLWLSLISQLSRLVLCRPTKLSINTSVSDVALKASCDACTTFRALQKKKQVAQPWLVVITQFQAGITILYILFTRSSPSPYPLDADLAIRDCTSVLAILADRWTNAERYRDCFEVLARAVPRCIVPGRLELDIEGRRELSGLINRVIEAGCHGHVRGMLWEMLGEENGLAGRDVDFGIS